MLRAAIVLLVVCLFATGAQALMVPATDTDRVADADEIVRGTLTSVRSQWNDDHTNIVTTAQVAVTKRMKGEGPDTFTIAALGGTTDGITQWAEDEPVLVPGIEAYLFVRAGSMANVQVHGRAQGVVPVISGRVSGGSLRKGAGIPVAEYDAYLTSLASGKAMARPNVVEPPEPSPRGVAATPVISSITPNTGSAGTWTAITITGTGFGTKASRDSPADVAFLFARSYDDSLTPIWASGFFCNDESGDPVFGDNANDIVSWSDTRIVVRVPTGFVAKGDPGGRIPYEGSAGSGPVVVVTDAGAKSAETPFTVTFGYGKMKWDAPAEYYVNPGSLGPEALTQINAAATSWNAAANPGATFRFNFAGQSNSTTFGQDGMNLICFGPESHFDSWTDIAHAMVWYRTGTSIIIEADVEFNSGFSWTTGTASGHTMNVERLTLHELGHWLHLLDLYGDISGYPSDTEKTMFGYVNDIVGNMNDKTLHPDDIAGIRWIYPDTATPPIASITPSNGSIGSTVPVTITGTGFAADSTVTLTRRRSTDIAATSVAVPSATRITCSFAIPATAATGPWNVVVTSGDRTVTLEDGFTVTGPDMTITTDAFTVAVDGTVDVPIVLDRAPYGVRGAMFTVTLSNGACADIVGFTFPAWAIYTDTEPSPFPGPCDNITFWMADDEGKAIPGGATNIPLGTLKVKGIAAGATSVVIDPYEDYGIADHDGEMYTVTASSGTVTVVAAATLVTIPGGFGLPQDLDGDGTYEDVTGNGRADFADVVLYFNQMNWIAANEPVAAFDYNTNGRIDFADVVWLFNSL